VREDVREPELPAGWALVAVSLAGVCGTDCEMMRGYKGGALPGALGHEFVGVVLRVADEERDRALVGRRVVGEINLPCLTCDVCARGGAARRSHCPRRRCLGIWQHGGAFAERLALPAANLLAVPDDVPLRAAVFCEPLAAACRVLEQAAALGLDLSARRSSAVAVLGDGRLGLLLAAVLCAQGAQAVTLVGRHPDKLARAARFAPSIRSVLARDAAALHGHFDIVVEVTGSHAGLEAATRLVRPLGAIVLKSTCATRAPAQPDEAAAALELLAEARNRVVVNEILLLGSRCGPMDRALAMLSAPDMQALLADMVDSTFPLSEAPRALLRAQQPGVLKVLIDCQAQAAGDACILPLGHANSQDQQQQQLLTAAAAAGSRGSSSSRQQRQQ
jgi:threonine dehydrogenase-like Zn-dependent dehydrogenase